MRREPLIMACCSDIAGQVRGKAFAARDFEQRCAAGIGWCPTNIQITAFDQIAETPFGALGDLLLKPDPGDADRRRFRPGSTPAITSSCATSRTPTAGPGSAACARP